MHPPMALKSLHLVNGKNWTADARLSAKLQDKISLKCFRARLEGSEGLELTILKFLPSFCIYDIIQETFKQPRWNEMSRQVVACDIYRQPLTHKERLQRSHTYKQLLLSAWPPPPCSCHGLCEKIKKERKGIQKKKKKLGPLADSAHSEAEEDKKLWK